MVVLPEPVGDQDDACWAGPAIECQRASSCSAGKPSSAMLRTSTSGSKMRITSFSPKAVGSVEGAARPPCRWPRVLMRPSWGRASRPHPSGPRILMRLVIADSAHRHLIHLVQHPSMRKRTAHVAPRLDVDVAGALLEGVLPQPSTTVHDVRSLASNWRLPGRGPPAARRRRPVPWAPLVWSPPS